MKMQRKSQQIKRFRAFTFHFTHLPVALLGIAVALPAQSQRLLRSQKRNSVPALFGIMMAKSAVEPCALQARVAGLHAPLYPFLRFCERMSFTAPFASILFAALATGCSEPTTHKVVSTTEQVSHTQRDFHGNTQSANAVRSSIEQAARGILNTQTTNAIDADVKQSTEGSFNRQTVNVGGSNNQDDTPKAKIKVTQSGYMNSQTLTIGQQPGR